MTCVPWRFAVPGVGPVQSRGSTPRPAPIAPMVGASCVVGVCVVVDRDGVSVGSWLTSRVRCVACDVTIVDVFCGGEVVGSVRIAGDVDPGVLAAVAVDALGDRGDA